MKGLIQRVSEAAVKVDHETVGTAGRGLLVLLGVERGDDLNRARDLCRRITTYRIFPDEQGRMNRSLEQVSGDLLVVSQFTLAADTRSGTRPGFSTAAEPALAESLYRAFLAEAEARLGAGRVQSGRFGADMRVSLVNEGPVTFLLEVPGRA
ncbi:D-aminoacyl-tRNA deacylase [Marinobacter sp. C2H3]|uniref:D-aminoacyl-tRNA deacylase n=1 Tax=Marinobacter sp. C2H3 TaxID=3119003 RepID=UPI00300F104D